MNTQVDMEKLGEALDDVEASGDEFAIVFATDNQYRINYKNTVSAFAEAVFNSVKAGEITAQEGARLASRTRNEMMAAARNQTSALGRSIAEFQKEHGKSTDELLNQYAEQHYRRKFSLLSAAQKNDVYLKVIEASGRPNPNFNRFYEVASFLGRRIVALSLLYSAKQVLESPHKADALKEELSLLLGGYAGGEIGAYYVAILIATGPARPVFIFGGMLLGGLIGADGAHRYVKKYLEHRDRH